jgi:hypothetical protein
MNTLFWGGVVFCQVGEDVKMGEYLVLGENGKLYKMITNDNRPVVGSARNDAKEGTNTLITLPPLMKG